MIDSPLSKSAGGRAKSARNRYYCKASSGSCRSNDSAPYRKAQPPHRRGFPESNGRLTVEAVICAQQRSCYHTMRTSRVTFLSKTDAPCAPPGTLRASHTFRVRLDSPNIWFKSFASLLGRPQATLASAPLAKR